MGSDEAGLIQRALGVLEGTVRSLADQWGRQEQEASKIRQQNNQQLDLLTRQIDRLSSDLHGVQQDVAELKNDYDLKIQPEISKMEAERNQRIGQKTVWALVYTGIAAIVASFGFLADKVIKHFWP